MALHILLADDSVPAQNMGKKILTDAGFEVTTASNGLEAIRKIAEAVPDVAVLDIFMPGYSGLEVCQKLRASEATATVPVVLTVGKLEPYRPEDGARVQSTAVIVKPFIAADLVKIVLDVAAQAGKTGASPAASPAAEESDEADEPIFSYSPTIPDSDTLAAARESSAYGAPAVAESTDTMLFNPDAAHVPFSASTTDFIPSISMGETHGAPVESAVADVNLETEDKGAAALLPEHAPLHLPPQELLPEITPPPLDIPTLDPLLDIGGQPVPRAILGESKIEVGELQEQFISTPAAPEEVLTPEEEARRRAFEELFNSEELPPLETAAVPPPVVTEAVPVIPLEAAAPPVVEEPAADLSEEATKEIPDAAPESVPERTPEPVEALPVEFAPVEPVHAEPLLAEPLPVEPVQAAMVMAESAPAEVPAVEEALEVPASVPAAAPVPEAAAAWDAALTESEFAVAAPPEEILPEWGAPEAVEAIGESFPADVPHMEAPSAPALEAVPEPAAEAVAEVAAEVPLAPLDEVHEPEAIPQEPEPAAAVEAEPPMQEATKDAAPEAPEEAVEEHAIAAPAQENVVAPEVLPAPEPEPAVEHHRVLEGLAGVAAGAGFASALPSAAAFIEEQVRRAIATIHPVTPPVTEHVPAPLVEEPVAAEAAAVEAPAPEAEVAEAEPQVVIPAETSATENADAAEAPEELSVPPVPAPAAEQVAAPEPEHEEAARVELEALQPARLQHAEVAVDAIAPEIVAPATPLEAAAPSASPSTEEVRSTEAERMHQAVERVFDRFKPLLIAAIVRELARTDTE